MLKYVEIPYVCCLCESSPTSIQNSGWQSLFGATLWNHRLAPELMLSRRAFSHNAQMSPGMNGAADAVHSMDFLCVLLYPVWRINISSHPPNSSGLKLYQNPLDPGIVVKDRGKSPMMFPVFFTILAVASATAVQDGPSHAGCFVSNGTTMLAVTWSFVRRVTSIPKKEATIYTYDIAE